MTNQMVAVAERLHHSTVKDLDKLYMAKQVARARNADTHPQGDRQSGDRSGFVWMGRDCLNGV